MAYRSVLVGFALVLWTTGTIAADKAVADKPGDTRSRLLQRMDRNGDGKISFEEYRNAMQRRFAARDKNNDGVLDAKEFPKEWLAGASEQASDHKITLEDFGGELEATFKRFDTNDDGQLEAGELDAFVAARKAQEESKP
jgi:hypothetical protein